MMWVILTILFFSSVFADLSIDLPDGKVRGHEIQSQNGSIYAFQGIPYATPPLGNLRFQSPLPPQPWNDILEANQTRESCIELLPFTSQSEDCLYVNVYTPARQITESLPVLVWIYGGGLITGSGSYEQYGPDALVKEDIIVVTFNYRIALFGFLSTGDDAILGNAGLKDQLQLLKWVKSNIAYFGGDPDKVTISGQSAGGISVGVHVVNSKAAGLFRGAICQSGCSLTRLDITSQKDPRKVAYDLAKIVNPSVSDSNTTSEIKDLLQSVDVEVLRANMGTPTGVVLEPDVEGAYVTELSFTQLESGNFNRVPLILGFVSEESLAFQIILPALMLQGLQYDTNVTQLLPSDFLPQENVSTKEVGNLIKEAYVGKDGYFFLNPAKVLQFASDNMFVRSILKQAEVQSNFTPVYLYQFSYYGTMSQSRPVIEGAGKVAHADELAYLFNTEKWLKTDADFLASKRFVRLWTNFAKTLNPTPDETDPVLNITWPQVTPANAQYIDIDDTLQIKSNIKAQESTMWDNVFYNYGRQPFTGF
ncbi:juvenile hormone esterase-like isoform X2 [Cylas formicarius]|uniref:juvenile hormone esterase-like isoform X2 n=1 Tax=Cylas formicarius TaxID=197179 RepID=UPI00295867D5|nr:juvenile hormone esterase-like isoform X2 [Cylas formicarius]